MRLVRKWRRRRGRGEVKIKKMGRVVEAWVR